jgi:hypothetical protein
MRRALISIIGLLVIAAIFAGDFFAAYGQETVVPPQLQLQLRTAEPAFEPYLVAQNTKRKKRRTLLDMLFGDDEDDEPKVRVQQQPSQAAPQKAALPPSKPEIEKSPTATRLAVMGDSLAVDLAKALERFYAEDPNLQIINMGVGSSGFVRPDFFDWNATVAEEITKNSFDLAVVLVGINDRQTLRADGESFESLTEGWTTRYQARVVEFVNMMRAANKPVIWVGLPPMNRDSAYDAAMPQISAIHRLAAFAGGAEFVDIYERFVDEEGKYSSFGPDLSGQRVRMRRDDGIHFSSSGADKLAFYLSASIKLFYRGGGGVGYEVADPLAGTDAQLMVRPPYQGLGQTRLLEVAGAVIPLTGAPKRADTLLTAQTIPAEAGFELTQLVQAPAGRADAFGVGILPGQNAAGR